MPLPSISLFAMAQGRGFFLCWYLMFNWISLSLTDSILLIVIVPEIVSSKYISTALAADRSLHY